MSEFTDMVACEKQSVENQMEVMKLCSSLAQILGLGYGIFDEKLMENKIYAAVMTDFEKKVEAHTSQMMRCMSPELREDIFIKDPKLAAKYGDSSKIIISEMHPFVTCVAEKTNNAGDAIKQFTKEKPGFIGSAPAHIVDMVTAAVIQINYCVNEHRDYFGKQEEPTVIIFSNSAEASGVEAKNATYIPDYTM